MTATSPIAALRTSLAADRATLRAAVDQVTADMRGRKPAPDRWSVADVLEHLSIIEARVVMMLGVMIPTAPERAGLVSSGLADAAIAAIRDRSSRVVAPDAIQPTGTVSPDAAWAALEGSRASLLALLDGAEGRDLTQITRQHPVLGPLDGYQWIAAIGGHEVRHAAQIVEIVGTLTS